MFCPGGVTMCTLQELFNEKSLIALVPYLEGIRTGACTPWFGTFCSHACPTYEDFWGLWVMGRLDLSWKLERMQITRGRLDEQFLSGHKNPASESSESSWYSCWGGETEKRPERGDPGRDRLTHGLTEHIPRALDQREPQPRHNPSLDPASGLWEEITSPLLK